jgi:hypothetical protein
MKPKLNPNYPSTGVLILVICSSLVLLAIGVPGIFLIREALATGRVYSMAVVFGDGEMIYRSSAPEAYWIMMGLYIPSCVGSLGFGTCVPISTIRAYIKKLARQKRERDSRLNTGNQ